MSYYINIGYNFKIPDSVEPDGSIILCSAMPYHQLERRRIDHRFPHLSNRLFDPQLYLAGLDASGSADHCLKLATYPWFGISGLNDYESSQQSQAEWKKESVKNITSIWPRVHPKDPKIINDMLIDCIDFQRRFGCWAIILPSPLTVDPSTNYQEELAWIDIALSHISDNSEIDVPIFATIAISDICLSYLDFDKNPLLDLILDSISARGIDGVYIVIEQSRAPSEIRHYSTTKTLSSLLHMIHLFTSDCDMKVIINFMGPFGLVCESAGAEIWCTNWYKSLYRLRLADKLAGGRAFPSYWSSSAITDIHLDNEFDLLVKAGLFSKIIDRTDASEGLVKAAQNNVKVKNVPAWQFRQSNITAAMEHYLLSTLNAERIHTNQKAGNRNDYVGNWLIEGVYLADQVSKVLGKPSQTRLEHIQAWHDAFIEYRNFHKV